ncbi:MAG TPA: DUF72 domain-containing protein [Terriglobales bacterium]|jgi:uncharacterized protein YecE (DUF72 family)|nr:DUF72 domain-containing protein [Terriglobales bacterium]
MPNLFIGTSGWAYPSWKPGFYPEKLAQTKFLTYYATQLNTVEVNLTFRQLLKDTTAQKWIEQTPQEFRFTIKAHQVITHIKRLKNSEEFLQRFISTIEPLSQAGKIGCVLFQLPPNLKADPKLLQDFLPAIPRGVKAAFEFRHESWFADDIFSCLKQHNRALCVAETEERGTPDVVTADFCYYRYRKPEYTPEERQAMLRRMQEHLSNGRDSYAYFKHEETPQGAIYAVDVLKQAGTAPA